NFFTSYIRSLYCCHLFYFSLILSSPISTLFPYTTLFRSCVWFITMTMPKSAAANSRRAFRLRVAGDLEVAPATRKRKARRLFARSEEHTSELQSRGHLVCRLLLEKKKKKKNTKSTVEMTL